MPAQPPPSGLVIVDKPAGITSHDVVREVRKLARTRKVGHAGTLDPMATGVLVLGVEKATRLLGYLMLTDKGYDATIRLGATTVTDDAEGDVIEEQDASGVTDEAIAEQVAAFTGEIDQVPTLISAVKIDGRAAYKRVRAGEEVELASRRVVVRRFDILTVRRVGAYVDVDVRIDCSTGTYVRALARDIGAALGVGGHLTALRRTRVGPYAVSAAHSLDQLERHFSLVSLHDAASAGFPRRKVDADIARTLVHGVKPPATGVPGPVAVFGPTGEFLALIQDRGAKARILAVFAEEAGVDRPPEVT